jgi:hypothetical protein
VNKSCLAILLPWLRSNGTGASAPENLSERPPVSEGNIHSGIGGYEGGSYTTGYLGQGQGVSEDLSGEG